jgi:tRNA A-37 threonylcarbamoyl transferase component Bud32
VSDAPAKPVRIGRFQIIRHLGRGATATVYLAHDPHNDREVALKVIKFGGDLEEGEARVKQHRRLRKLFQTEGAVAARLDHPNIVKVYDTVVDENTALMAMEYVEGPTLAEYCAFDRLLPLPRVVGIIFKCCLALDYAYRQGVVHRDIKPANIMVGPDVNPKIMDFGLALNVQNPAIPPELDPIVKRALEKDLYSRYRTGADFGKDLASARYQLLDEEAEKLNDRFELLRSLPVFAQFERVELWEVLRITTWRKVDDGVALMEEGSDSRTFGVLIDGEVEVSLDHRQLARLGPGEVLGEIAFLSPAQAVRSATVVAVGEVTFLEVNLAAYELASEECKEHFQNLLIGALIRRLRSANAKVIQHAPPARIPLPSLSSLELVPESDLDAPLPWPGNGSTPVPWPGRAAFPDSAPTGTPPATAPAGPLPAAAPILPPGMAPELPGSDVSAANSTFGDASRTLVMSPDGLEGSTTGATARSRSRETP